MPDAVRYCALYALLLLPERSQVQIVSQPPLNAIYHHISANARGTGVSRARLTVFDAKRQSKRIFFGSEAQAAQQTYVHRTYCYTPPTQSGIEICRHFYHCRNAAKVYRKLTALKRNISSAIAFCNRIYPNPPAADTVRQKNLKCQPERYSP